jgi:hypothetical protein
MSCVETPAELGQRPKSAELHEVCGRCPLLATRGQGVPVESVGFILCPWPKRVALI